MSETPLKRAKIRDLSPLQRGYITSPAVYVRVGDAVVGYGVANYFGFTTGFAFIGTIGTNFGFAATMPQVANRSGIA
jgi:hypothetical protein